jgi:HEXXH motif-containing protein
MSLTQTIFEFLRAPFPIWEDHLTKLLVEAHQPKEPVQEGAPGSHWLITADPAAGPTYLSCPSITDLVFYEENGLMPQSTHQLLRIMAADKIRDGLKVLAWEEPVKKCIAQLVRSIHVVGSPDDEIDVSYSHPDWTSTIFVSVCRDSSLLSQLRVAESILHEGMHLKLSLIERIVPITNPFTGNLYFSPWRDEGRPAQGIVHGLFVFRAILEFFRLIKGRIDQMEAREHLACREQQILGEMDLLKNFKTCPDLTPSGAILTANLTDLEY